jgi:hypothetical protein
MVSQNRPRAMPILLDSRLNFLWTSRSGGDSENVAQIN